MERQAKKNRHKSKKMPGPSTLRQQHGMNKNRSMAPLSQVPRAISPQVHLPGLEALSSQAHIIKLINPLCVHLLLY